VSEKAGSAGQDYTFDMVIHGISKKSAFIVGGSHFEVASATTIEVAQMERTCHWQSPADIFLAEWHFGSELWGHCITGLS
jgi:hypothetical protein